MSMYNDLVKNNYKLKLLNHNIFYDTYEIVNGVLLLDNVNKHINFCTQISVGEFEKELLHVLCNNFCFWVEYKHNNYKIIKEQNYVKS